MTLNFVQPHTLDLSEYMLPGIQMQWLEEYQANLLIHIANVREAGRRLGVPELTLMLHDASKFMTAEFPYYARQFYGDRGDPVGFSYAWLHHQNYNDHHWEHFILRSLHLRDNSGADEETGCLPMPDHCLHEMVADWMGASKTYTDDWSIRQWYDERKEKIKLHPESRIRLHKILKEIRYGD